MHVRLQIYQAAVLPDVMKDVGLRHLVLLFAAHCKLQRICNATFSMHLPCGTHVDAAMSPQPASWSSVICLVAASQLQPIKLCLAQHGVAGKHYGTVACNNAHGFIISHLHHDLNLALLQ